MNTPKELKRIDALEEAMDEAGKELPVGSGALVRHWRVTTARPEPNPDIRNPFLVRDVFQSAGQTRFRTYEFDAKDEAECRQLFAQAQEAGIEEVRGFHITKVEEIPSPNSQLSSPETPVSE
jgi:hypothetical protein